MSKEQRLERRKLRREAELAKCKANKHKTIPSGEALEVAKKNQVQLEKKLNATKPASIAKKHDKQAITDKLKNTLQQRTEAATEKVGKEEYEAWSAQHKLLQLRL